MRKRIIQGARAQLVSHVARVVVQVGVAGVLLPTWGLELYGDWLILVGAAVLLGAADFGFLSAAVSDMNQAVGRGDQGQALDVFRTVARGFAVVGVVLFGVVAAAVILLPIVSLLGLRGIGHGDAAAILLMIAAQVLLVVASLLFYGGFTCTGHYGEGILIQSGIVVAEFGAACVTAALRGSPVSATAALLATRTIGTAVMYISMRHRAPWLSFGRPAAHARVRQRLSGPALASASIGWAGAINVQVITLIVGITTGPASAAIFGTVRTLSRTVIQITGSISQSVSPEVAQAHGRGDSAVVDRLQYRINQAATWVSVLLVVPLAIFGDRIFRIWTSGRVHTGGALLVLLLVVAVVESAWTAAGSVLFFTNRHARLGVVYAVLMVVNMPLAYGLATAFGRNGVAFSLVIVGLMMLVAVLREALPAAHSTFFRWLSSLIRPVEAWRALVALRVTLMAMRAARQ